MSTQDDERRHGARATLGAPTHQSVKEFDEAFRHRGRGHLSRLRAGGPHADDPKAQRAAGRRPADPHARTRPLLPEGPPAAPATRRVLSADRRRLHADRHDLDRPPPHEPGVPRVDRGRVALPLRPWAEGRRSMSWFKGVPSAQALARLSSGSPPPPCGGGAPQSNPDSMAGRPVGPVASPARATIGLGQAVALYLGAILGAGVLILPGV